MPNVNGEWIMLGTTEKSSDCLKSVEQLEALVDSLGFLPLFANSVPGFSVSAKCEGGFSALCFYEKIVSGNT